MRLLSCLLTLASIAVIGPRFSFAPTPVLAQLFPFPGPGRSGSGGGGGGGSSAAIRSASTLAYASHTNSVVTAPAGIVNGDILLIYMASGAGTPPTTTPPTGFTAVTGFPAANTFSGFTVTNYCWYKVASSESGNYTVTHTAASTEIFMAAISGASTSAPTATTNSGTGSTTTALTVTTPSANAVVMFFSQDWGDTANSLTAPTGTTPTLTKRFGGVIVLEADGVLASAGATGNKTITNNNTVIQHPFQGSLVAVGP